MPVNQDSWDARLASAVGRNVKRLRQERSTPLSALALSDRTRDLGHPVHRSVIAKLENGERASVTLGDLFVLSRALNVPPFALLAPLTLDDLVEVLPGRMLKPWYAVDWLNGRGNYVGDPVTDEEGFGEYERVSDVYEHRFRYQMLAAAYVEALRNAEASTGVLHERDLSRVESLRSQMAQVAAQMEIMGVTSIPALGET